MNPEGHVRQEPMLRSWKTLESPEACVWNRRHRGGYRCLGHGFFLRADPSSHVSSPTKYLTAEKAAEVCQAHWFPWNRDLSDGTVLGKFRDSSSLLMTLCRRAFTDTLCFAHNPPLQRTQQLRLSPNHKINKSPPYNFFDHHPGYLVDDTSSPIKTEQEKTHKKTNNRIYFDRRTWFTRVDSGRPSPDFFLFSTLAVLI